MTTNEYIKSVLSKFNVSSADVELILLDNDLNGLDNVNVTEAKTAIHKSLSVWLPIHKSMDEGNVSETWNHEAVMMYYSLLCKELGLENLISNSETEKVDVRDKSNLW